MAISLNIHIGGKAKGKSRRFYSHSGRVPLLGPVLMVAVGLLAALVLGGIYGYALFYIPLIYLNALMVLLFGGAMGWVLGRTAKFTKVRNNAVILTVTFVLTLVAEYVGWVSWFLAASEQELLLLLPGQMLRAMSMLAKEGPWSALGVTPTGIGLYAVWLAEALLILGTALAGAHSVVGSLPFCEPCDRWVEDKVSLPRLQPTPDADRLRGKLMAGRYEEIAALGRATASTNPFTRVDVRRCPDCDRAYFLTLSQVETSVDKDGKPKEAVQPLVENLIINRETFAQLQAEAPAPSNLPPRLTV